MAKLATWGNELYSGKRSYPFIGQRKLWFGIALVLIVLSVLVPVVRGGFNLGIDFRGGNEFQVAQVHKTDPKVGDDAAHEVIPDKNARTTHLASNTMRVQTDPLTGQQADDLKAALAKAYETDVDKVSVSAIGPTWGADVSRQAGIGLVVFMVLVALLMALYFRTWKMSFAAVGGLIVVMIVTSGIYAAVGFEVTPSAVIGFLTILSYCLYDTVVVFDKIRENTSDPALKYVMTFEEKVNRAVNQTLVRSINTSVVAILPVGSILFIGYWLLGAGTLGDLALALFVGIIVSTLSTLFIQAPLYYQLRKGDADVKELDAEVAQHREESAEALA